MATITTKNHTILRPNPVVDWLSATDTLNLYELRWEDAPGNFLSLPGVPVNADNAVIQDAPDNGQTDYSAAVRILNTSLIDGALRVETAFALDEDENLTIDFELHVLTAPELARVRTLDDEIDHFILKALPKDIGSEPMFLYGSGSRD